MNNPFDYSPGEECNEAFHDLLLTIDALKNSTLPADRTLCHELSEGKMLGVLIAEDSYGNRHTLYAFSGQIGNHGFHHPLFVPPVFDYLQPDGYFKTREAEISSQSAEIARFENEILNPIRKLFNRNEQMLMSELEGIKEGYRLSKLKRDAKRNSRKLNAEEEAVLIRQSQFEKAELRRIKSEVRSVLSEMSAQVADAEAHLKTLKEKRRADSEALQKWLFDNFTVLNAHGESESLSTIFARTALKTPPSGAGECCAPKLLQTAYIQGLTPVAIAEYWYGKPKGGEVRRHGAHYPACRGKCLPILTRMLQGLDINPPLNSPRESATPSSPQIIYENQWFCIINKPAGMLSVPGKGDQPSVQQWLQHTRGEEKEVRLAHRLDQDTSGLLIATFGDLPYRIMQRLFTTRQIHKTYIADLEGDYTKKGVAPCGRIELSLSPDRLDRPRQHVDHENGKEAITDYRFIGINNNLSRIEFKPLTGRTHQLRVHAASDQGLGMPIAGDPLYGRTDIADRLRLHAAHLEFTFPLDGKRYTFDLPCPF